MLSRKSRLLIFVCFCFLPVFLSGKSTAYKPVYKSLKDSAPELGLKYETLKSKEEALLSNEWLSLKVKIHQKYVYLNGVRVYLGYPVIYRRGSLQVTELDYNKNLKSIIAPNASRGVPELNRIVLDAGHGGKDPGAMSTKFKINEKTMALTLVMVLKELLEEQGYEVFLTRKNDKFMSLEQRVTAANMLDADLFVSLHFNALKIQKVRGIETYCLTPRWQPSSARDKLSKSDTIHLPGNKWDAWNALFAYYTQSRLEKELNSPGRGLKRARFAVLKKLECPGILIEGGFLTNTQDAVQIQKKEYRKKIAKAIVNSIILYQKTIKRLKHT